MAWEIEISETAIKHLKKIDHKAQKQILKYLKERIAPIADPRSLGAPLRGSLSGLWKYRVGDYRIIVEIRDKDIVILVLQVGHRKNIYGGH